MALRTVFEVGIVKILPNQPVEFKVEVDNLVIAGGRDELTMLAENIATLKEAPSSYHIHIEHFEEHFYIGPNSLPVVIIHQ